jgi:hypothetical protein
MNCKNVHKLIQDYIDGRLAADERKLVGSHIDGCAKCARELRELDTLATLLGRMALEPAPQGFADRIIAKLKAGGQIVEPAAAVATGGLFRWTRDRFKVSLAGAMLLLLAIALFPATIGPLEGMVGKGTVLVTDTYLQVQERAADADILTRVLDSLQKNLRTLKTVVLAGFSLLARAGELFMIPALATIFLLTLAVLFFLRMSNKRSAQHATYSF